jgi:hypothetical protein
MDQDFQGVTVDDIQPLLRDVLPLSPKTLIFLTKTGWTQGNAIGWLSFNRIRYITGVGLVLKGDKDRTTVLLIEGEKKGERLITDNTELWVAKETGGSCPYKLTEEQKRMYRYGGPRFVLRNRVIYG